MLWCGIRFAFEGNVFCYVLDCYNANCLSTCCDLSALCVGPRLWDLGDVHGRMLGKIVVLL